MIGGSAASAACSTRTTRFRTKVDWFYLTALPYFNPIGPPTGYYTLNGQQVCGCDDRALCSYPYR